MKGLEVERAQPLYTRLRNFSRAWSEENKEGEPPIPRPELREASRSLSAKSSEKAPRLHGYVCGPVDRT